MNRVACNAQGASAPGSSSWIQSIPPSNDHKPAEAWPAPNHSIGATTSPTTPNGTTDPTRSVTAYNKCQLRQYSQYSTVHTTPNFYRFQRSPGVSCSSIQHFREQNVWWAQPHGSFACQCQDPEGRLRATRRGGYAPPALTSLGPAPFWQNCLLLSRVVGRASATY